MEMLRATVDQRGRIVIPAQLRAALDLHAGDSVVLALDGGDLRVRAQAEAVRRAQDLAIELAGGRSLVDELIAERRAEAHRE